MKNNRAAQIAAYLATNPITRCPPAGPADLEESERRAMRTRAMLLAHPELITPRIEAQLDAMPDPVPEMHDDELPPTSYWF